MRDLANGGRVPATVFRRSALAVAVSGALMAGPIQAQEAQQEEATPVLAPVEVEFRAER